MKWKFLQSKLLVVCLILMVQPVFAGNALNDEFLFGLDLFKEARYKQSIRLFLAVVNDTDSDDIHGDATYWLSRSYLESGDLVNSSLYLDDFLINYPSHALNIPGQYYKGRILFMQKEYDKSIHYFSSFLTSYPNSPYYGNSLFWIGESLYFLGKFEEAGEIFSNLLEKYPGSVKTEASRYRLSLIEYRYREEELLKLLQWSHEEFLKSSGDYEQKEKEFNQALAVYQEKLIELTKTREIYDNRLKLLALKEEALDLKQKLFKGLSGGESGE
jgi:TolA-binding protein